MVMGGRASVRKALYMPTVTAIRRNPAIKALYERLTGRGNPAKIAPSLRPCASCSPSLTPS